MENQKPPSVGQLMDRFLGDLDPADMRANLFTQEFLVIPGHVNNSRTFPHAAQHFLHDVVVRLRPVP